MDDAINQNAHETLNEMRAKREKNVDEKANQTAI